MKRLIYSLIISTIAVGTPVIAQPTILDDAPADADIVDPVSLEVRLQSHGNTLSELLDSRDDRMRQIAMRMIIRDGDEMAFSRRDVQNVVQIFRAHRDSNMRRMAVVALGNMNDTWALDVLSRSAHRERVPQVRHTIVSVLADEVPMTDVPAATQQIAREGDR